MAEWSGRIRGALSRAAVRTAQRAEGPPRTTQETLVEWARAHVRDRRLVVMSNREPYSHVRRNGGIRVIRNAGGLTVALDAVAQALGGVWVAHGAGDADRETADVHSRVPCPPDRPRYTLRRVWLDQTDEQLYYQGFANGALWPLCHIVYVRPRFRTEDWERYRDVNRRFAEAALEEAGDGPALVFLQDYHLAVAAQTLRERRPNLHLALFWHIPWPNPEVFQVLPWRRELLEGMLANDLVGFHTRGHAMNFLDSVAQTLEARVDRERLAVERGGRRTWVRHFPISVPAEEIAAIAEAPETLARAKEIQAQLHLEGVKVLLGVDRLDYTKGIPERLEALKWMLHRHPEWVGKLCMIQIGVPSRIELSEYQQLVQRTHDGVDEINRLFPREGGNTVELIEANLDFSELVPYYRLADLCAVTSLHDGMNLVAKEYVAASPDLEGSLVLSPFTGAAKELERAWIASPYESGTLADAFFAAIHEAPESRRERMAALRETVLRRNIYDWAIEVLDTALDLNLRVSTPETRESAPEPGVSRRTRRAISRRA